jgi:hypothetical protein
MSTKKRSRKPKKGLSGQSGRGNPARTPALTRFARYWFIGLIALILVVGVGFFALRFSRTPGSEDAESLDVAAALPKSEAAFNVSTRVGQPAPAFTLADAQGRTYAFKPGDGRKYVLAFNMGYV